ncbi:MAG: tetratricopeptide repeat protein [Oscillospiraceae bacterium]|nr:tetratricopeptide repeat protein [Oscillospiraceae bacterium]
MSFEYDVFFSYRHRPLDGEITQKAFNAIESYRLPRAIRKSGCEDIRRAFRDTEELPVSRILTETIDRALHSANCLVVVCSLDTPSSEWIDREVSIFIELGRAEHIYPLLISGDPEHSFPPSLKLVPDIQDRIMDIRVPGSPVKKMMARAETELLRVIAGVVGCKESDLQREHRLRRNRRFAARTAAAAGTFLAVAGISLGLMHLAQGYRNTARQREEASLRILNELTYSLPDHLTNVPGAYSRIAGILRQNTEDINALLRLSDNRQTAAYEAAANYEKLATAESVLGAYEEAAASEEKAIVLFEELAADRYEGSAMALASAYNNRGRILNAVGRYAEAEVEFNRAVEHLQAEEDPLFYARVMFNAGANGEDAGANDRAELYFKKSLEALEQAEESAERVEVQALANYNYGVLLYRTGKFAQAEERLTEACRWYDRLLEWVDSLQNRNRKVQALSVLATCLTNQGRYDEAGQQYEQAIQIAEELAANTDNLDDLRRLAELYNNRGLGQNIQGDYVAADRDYTSASALYKQVMERTGTDTDTAVYALTLLNTGENAFKLGEYPVSKREFREGLQLYGTVCERLGDRDISQYYAWRSYYELIHERDPQAALEAGIAAVQAQPESILANLNLAYACLYAGYEEDAVQLFTQIIALGEGMSETIRGDLEAQQRAGMEADALPVFRELLN